jgi:hypothetical protein
VIQSAFSPATTGPGEAVWLGDEAGILVALTLVLAAVLISLGTWRMFRSPGRPMAAAPSSA